MFKKLNHNGNNFEFPDNEKGKKDYEAFIAKFPDATEVAITPDPDEEGKGTPSQETVDAAVEVDDTASKSEDFLSVFQRTSARKKTRQKDLAKIIKKPKSVKELNSYLRSLGMNVYVARHPDGYYKFVYRGREIRGYIRSLRESFLTWSQLAQLAKRKIRRLGYEDKRIRARFKKARGNIIRGPW